MIVCPQVNVSSKRVTLEISDNHTQVQRCLHCTAFVREKRASLPSSTHQDVRFPDQESAQQTWTVKNIDMKYTKFIRKLYALWEMYKKEYEK